jgi:hypothetical protein
MTYRNYQVPTSVSSLMFSAPIKIGESLTASTAKRSAEIVNMQFHWREGLQ